MTRPQLTMTFTVCAMAVIFAACGEYAITAYNFAAIQEQSK